MYFPAKEIYTRTTNSSSFYATLCRFINCSLPRIFFKKLLIAVNKHRCVCVCMCVCVLSTVRFENFKGRDQLINTETIFKLVKLEFKRTTQMRGSYETVAGVPVTAEEWAQDLLSHITVKPSSIYSPWLHMGEAANPASSTGSPLLLK